MEKDIKTLLEEYLKILDSGQNKERKEYYIDTDLVLLDKFRGVPDETRDGRVPYIFWVGLDTRRELFGIDIEKMYREPAYYLECWLRSKIYHFKNFNDCNYFGDIIPLWLGEGFESTFFGCKLKYSKDSEPSVDRDFTLIKDKEDLKKLKVPDFENTEAMYHAMRFYNEINNLAEDYGIRAAFFDWHYGPTALCNYLRGFENISIDYLTDKDLVRNIMQLVVDSRIRWVEVRKRITGDEGNRGVIISNDDVSAPNVSPSIYRELILPYEKMIHRHFGYFTYYHNCGPIDPFLNDVNTIGRIDMIHSGPFSDYRKVGEVFGKRSAIELHLHPEKDFISSTEQDFRKRLLDIRDYYEKIGVKAYCIRLTSYSHPSMTMSENIEKLKKWCGISSEILLPGN